MLGWASFGLALFLASTSLWTGLSSYPQVPLLEPLTGTAAWTDWVACAAIVLCMVASLRLAFSEHATQLRPVALLVFILGLSWLFLTNQHRLQPWAYLAWLVAIGLLIPDRNQSLKWLRALAISIYVYSAITKLDHQFLHTLGQQFLAVITNRLGIEISNIGASTRIGLSAAFPIIELLVGAGLCWRRTRRIAVAISVVMHVSLLLVLSPLGLNHKPCVLIWNLYFVWQNVVLFWWEPRLQKDQDESLGIALWSRLLAIVPKFALFIAMLLPVFQPWGRFDHWPSWGLYAPSNSRVEVFIEESAIESLPVELKSYCTPLAFHDPEFDVPVQRLRTDWWSLNALNVPIYPQLRFQIGVAWSIQSQIESAGGRGKLRLYLESASDRYDGTRRSTELDTPIADAASDFFFNTMPKSRVTDE